MDATTITPRFVPIATHMGVFGPAYRWFGAIQYVAHVLVWCGMVWCGMVWFTSHGGDAPTRLNLADFVVVPVGDEEVAGLRVDDHL